jgi:hypothetical protein
MPLHTLIVPYPNLFFNVKKGPICFKLVPGILDPGPLSKVALRLHLSYHRTLILEDPQENASLYTKHTENWEFLKRSLM